MNRTIVLQEIIEMMVMNAYDNFLSLMIPGTIYIKGKKVDDENENKDPEE